MTKIIYTKPPTGPIVFPFEFCRKHAKDVDRVVKTQAYITSDFLVVEVMAPIWDLPPWIHCRFPNDDDPYRARQAFWLTTNLFERVMARVARAEDAWASGNPGELTEANLRLVQVRMKDVVEAYERLPQFSEMETIEI